MDLGHFQRPTNAETIVPREPQEGMGRTGRDSFLQGAGTCWLDEGSTVSVWPPPGVGVPSWGLLATLSILMARRTALHKETERVEGSHPVTRSWRQPGSAFCSCHTSWAGSWGCGGVAMQSCAELSSWVSLGWSPGCPASISVKPLPSDACSGGTWCCQPRDLQLRFCRLGGAHAGHWLQAPRQDGLRVWQG